MHFSRRLYILMLALIAASSLSTFSQVNSGNAAGQGKFASVNNLKMYYEVQGDGPPLVLLHGAYMSIEGPIREMMDSLSKSYKVIAPELQGHGRTNDVDRPFSYEAMADDVIKLMQLLKIDSAHVIGYSMGSGVALQVAIRQPASVKKLVIISGSYAYNGMQPAFLPLIPQITPAMFEGTPMKTEYEKLSPHPSKFPVLVEKLKQLDLADFNWEKSYVDLKHSMLLIFGDADVVTLDHIRDMFVKKGGNVMGDLQPLPNIQLAILPATSHIGVMNRLGWISPMITEFLRP